MARTATIAAIAAGFEASPKSTSAQSRARVEVPTTSAAPPRAVANMMPYLTEFLAMYPVKSAMGTPREIRRRAAGHDVEWSQVLYKPRYSLYSIEGPDLDFSGPLA